MTQYRKKPDVIEAWPVRELNRAAGHEWKALPQSMRDAYRQGGWVFGVFTTDNDATSGRGIYIPTLAGSLWAAPEDMVIRGVNGEFYPCKPDIFAASYEPAAPPMTPADPIPTPPVTPSRLARRVPLRDSEEEHERLWTILKIGNWPWQTCPVCGATVNSGTPQDLHTDWHLRNLQ